MLSPLFSISAALFFSFFPSLSSPAFLLLAAVFFLFSFSFDAVMFELIVLKKTAFWPFFTQMFPNDCKFR